MSTQELARVESRMPRRNELEDLATLANHLAKSNRFPDSHNGYEALAKLMFGRDLGLSATAAMTGVHIVEGKPEIGANIQAQMVRSYRTPEGERYDYRILTLTETECSIEFGRGQAPGRDENGNWIFWPDALGVAPFSIEDAQRAGLVKDRGGWAKYPRNMLFARAMSNGVAFFTPEVTNGIRVYHEGELDAARAAPEPNDSPVVPVVMHTAPDADVVADADVVPDPEPDAPEPSKIDEPTVRQLVDAARATGMPHDWIRLQLADAGVKDVPEGPVRLGVWRGLTLQQAQVLLVKFLQATPDPIEANRS